MKTNSEVRYASHPNDAKHYDTAQLRENYLIEKVFTPDQVNMVYTMHDRMIAGVCGGIGEYFDIAPTLIRILWVTLLFMAGGGLVAYLIAWIVIPNASQLTGR